MDRFCYRCGDPVEEKTPFCPSCGAPQIRVPARGDQAQDPTDTASWSSTPAPPAGQPDFLPGQPVFQRTVQEATIDWKGFLRIAAPLVLLVGLFILYNPLVGWLVALPASIFIAVHLYQRLYRRRHPLPLKAWQGAKLGTLIGFLGFALQSTLLIAVIAHDPGTFRREAMEQVKQALANSPDPQAREMVMHLISTPGGMVFMIAMGMVLILALLLTIGGVSGALAASMVRKKPGP